MKIGMILDDTFPPDPRVENEAVTLINSGHEVFLFCLTYGNQKAIETINGIKVRRYKSTKLAYKLSALSYDLPFYRMLMKRKVEDFIKETKVAVLHVHDIRIAGTVFKVNQKFQLKIILDLHDNIPENMKYYPHLNKFPGKYIISPKKWKKKEEEFIHKSDKVITVSPNFAKEIVERTSLEEEKMVLVPNTVRQSFYKEAIISKEVVDKYKNKFVVLYLGDTNIRRGLLTAIRATEKLKQEIENFKLVIVGKNTTDYILREEVEKMKLQAYVDFEGWQNVSLFPSYILASTICISPLYRSVQHDVAYANKVFQYMSLGKPVLVSDAIAQKEIVEKSKSGLVHKEKNVDDFSDKVLELYKNEDMSHRLGENGRGFIEKEFSWEVTSQALVELYEKL
ncbi:MAG: glycosyltransferase family 4 protein [Flavobacteriaceae bacterium]|nr:glycosyltransferase family 4 protein [Flavobacteriaceae bacterium]